MLGQHPEMYGFPELNLFLTCTVAELFQLDDRMSNVVGRQEASYTPGLTRTVAQLLYRGQSEDALVRALAWLKDRARWNGFRMLGYLLRLVAPQIGVDKSPRTCLSTTSLRRAFAFHPGTRFLHLTRDPVCTIRSIVEKSAPQDPSAASASSTVERSEFAVRLWCFCQQTILRETAGLSSQRLIRVHGENVLNHPVAELSRISRWLGIRDDPDAIEPMLHPERSSYAYVSVWPSGGDQDPGFLANPRLRRAQSSRTPNFLGSLNLEPQHRRAVLMLARELGYSDCELEDLHGPG
jgi:hypothetical protein